MCCIPGKNSKAGRSASIRNSNKPGWIDGTGRNNNVEKRDSFKIEK
jgi:hypothetical protein